MPPRVSILVLNWNNWRDTNECLASLQSLEYPNWDAIVLDNGSTDDSIERIRERFPAIEILKLRSNLGFAKGNNAGIRAGLERGAEYVWLLNNDTEVTPQSLSAMIEKAEVNPSVGAVGSVLMYKDRPNEIQLWGGGRVNFWMARPYHFSVPVKDTEIEYICGASLLISRVALLNIGPLDEDFFMYWEDVDYCFRLRKAGLLLAVAADSTVLHKGSASFESGGVVQDSYYTRASKLFFQKHAVFPRFSFWMGVAILILKRAFLGRWENLRAVWSAATSGPPRPA
jgi:GT2 family glycosyltransferase